MRHTALKVDLCRLLLAIDGISGSIFSIASQSLLTVDAIIRFE
jgi:hypothetical protein